MLSTAQRRNIIAAIEAALSEYKVLPRYFMVEGLIVHGDRVRLNLDGIKPKGEVTVDAIGETKIER